MADNTKTAKIWQEAAAETKECLPLEVLERMMETLPPTRRLRRTWRAARTADGTCHAEEL